MSFWDKVLCNLLGWHHKGIVIRYGYAVTTCERCWETFERERLPDA